MVDQQRLEATLGDSDLAWLLVRLRRRLEQGQPLTGNVTLRHATPAQRSAVDRLLGRKPSSGNALTVRLEDLAAILQHGELCSDLTGAVQAMIGPVEDLRARQRQLDLAWEELRTQSRLECGPAAEWLDDVWSCGLLRRLSNNDLAEASRLLRLAFRVLAQLPASSIPLAELSARSVGDSHALDLGRPLGTLVIRAVGRMSGIDTWDDVQGRRDAWAGVGVLVDELSSPILVLNLRGDRDSLTGRALNLYAEAGEPCRVSVRQLLRHPPEFHRDLAGSEVYVCENQAVVAAAADRLGCNSRPVICIDGQPKTAARLLLDRLRAAGIRLLYHGDFDWPGIQIANLIIDRHAALAWRFGCHDYRQLTGGIPLAGSPVAACWDAELMPAMLAAGRGIHEEQVLDSLLEDLGADERQLRP
jgi:uncharacterized protein (TIGR02679 family)